VSNAYEPPTSCTPSGYIDLDPDKPLEPNCITLSSSLAGRRPVRDQIPLHYPASDQLASRSAASSRAGRSARQRRRNGVWPEPVCNQVRAISTCWDSSNLSATGRKPGLRPGHRNWI